MIYIIYLANCISDFIHNRQSSIDIIDIIKDWQTLVGSFIALLAAIGTIFVIKEQIKVSERHENERKKAKERASRAVLVFPLSAIMSYLAQSSEHLRSIYKKTTPEQFPSIPEPAIDKLQLIIEAFTNEIIIKTIAKLMQEIQIHNARLESVQQGKNSTAYEIEGKIIYSAVIHALASSLFSYARFDSESIKEIEWIDVERSLSILEWGDEYTCLRNTLKIKKINSPLKAFR